MNDIRAEILDILDDYIPGSYLPDMTKAVSALLEKKIREARIDAYRSVPEVRGLTEEGLEDVNRWLWKQIDELEGRNASNS